jgi:hypothetical protein
MYSPSNVVKLDTKRMRQGMRGLAHEIVLEISSPLNADLWKPPATTQSQRVTAAEIKGALGPIADLWTASDLDAATRIVHMTLLLLYAVSSDQYSDRGMIERALMCQASAEAVKARIAESDELQNQNG